MDADTVELQITIEVDVVKVQEGEYPWITLSATLARADFGFLEMRAEQAGGEPFGPLVQVPENDFVSAQMNLSQDLLAEELARLFSALEERRTEVEVKDV